jgi:peptidoglycan/xylan/chitin deacetylase (PgdA/CDA1 family)
MVGISYSLRCLVFHNISDKQSPFTAGITVNTAPQTFEKALKYLAAHYRPVSLEDVLTDCDGRGLPPRALLITFDDAYASVAEYAAPVCKQLGVPAVFFINAAFLDNQRLAPDNLVCYVASVLGLATINRAVRAVLGNDAAGAGSLSEVFGVLFPSLSLAERGAFLETLRELAGIDERRIAKEAGLYLTSEQLGSLASFGFEIGNHTYTHTHGRSLSPQDFASEIDRNKRELEALSGTTVRTFSQPYGSSKDLSDELTGHLRQTGHKAVFLSESVANPRKPDLYRLDRISSRAKSDDALFVEVELMPRLRAIRNRLFKKPRKLEGRRCSQPSNGKCSESR